MIDISIWKMAWSILDKKEKKGAIVTLAMVIVGGFSAASMVGSIMPFLAVLTDPSLINKNPILKWSYSFFEFKTNQNFIIALGCISLVIIFISIGIQVIKNWIVLNFSMSKMHSLSMRLLEKYLSQSYEFFLNQHSGELSSKVLSEVDKAVFLFYRPASEFIASAITIFIIVCLLLWVNPIIAIFAFLVLGGMYMAMSLMTRRQLHQLGIIRFKQNNNKYRIASESLTGIKDIKLLGKEHSYLQKYSIPSNNMANVQIKTSLLSSIPSLGIQAVALGGMIMICLFLVSQQEAADGKALGALLPLIGIFALAGQRLLPELTRMYGSFAEMQSGAPVIKALYIDLTTDIGKNQIRYISITPIGLKKILELKNISYRYPNAKHCAIKNVNVSIYSGEKIGVVGTSGSGKTTLADVILGLLQPLHGNLSIDGLKIDKNNVQSWMQSVGYVPQDIFLTDASIAENIALGINIDNIDFTRIAHVASIAKIHEFIIHELPDGYMSMIGERGVRLSGGQRQRIGIARALYHDADLIVFDEATSALDNITEQEVMEAIDTLPGDKTVIMIAHRLSTVKRCDRIIVLDKGEFVACDTWNQLMKNNSVFKNIAQIAETY